VSLPLSPDASIKEARPKDFPAIATLAAVVWRSHYPGIISTAQIEYMLEWMYSVPEMRMEMKDKGIHYVRLLVRDKLVGFAACGPTESAGVFKLHKLYLHPDHQRRGLGSRLLVHCLVRARSLGASSMTLQVNKQNGSAVEVYRRNGFRIAEEALVDIGGGFVMDDFIMVKDLDEAKSRSVTA
jgi:GNAT superfamily N-acetyltransferase